MMFTIESFLSPEFLVSLILVLMYQGSLFTQFSTEDLDFDKFQWITNLKTYHLITPKTYYGYLLIYIFVSAVVFTLLCSISPPIIKGWMILNGQSIDDSKIGDVPYQLFLAAAYMGITQVVPNVTNVGLLQRSVFHQIIGVPQKILHLSDGISNSINAAHQQRTEKVFFLQNCISPREIALVDDNADMGFLRKNLRMLKIINTDDELTDLSVMSDRELKKNIDQMVLVLIVAIIKRSGFAGVRAWAIRTGVDLPAPFGTRLGAILPAILFSLFGLILIWFLLPLLTKFLENQGVSVSSLLPSDMRAAGIYVAAQMMPIVISVLISIYFRPGLAYTEEFRPEFRNGPTLFTCIILFNIFYCYAIMLYDLGLNIGNVNRDNLGQIALRFPYHVLQSLTAVNACLIVLRFTPKIILINNKIKYGINRLPLVQIKKANFIRACIVMIIGVGIPAAIYAYSRSVFHFSDKPELDQYQALIIILNVIAGIISLLSTTIYYGGDYHAAYIRALMADRQLGRLPHANISAGATDRIHAEDPKREGPTKIHGKAIELGRVSETEEGRVDPSREKLSATIPPLPESNGINDEDLTSDRHR